MVPRLSLIGLHAAIAAVASAASAACRPIDDKRGTIEYRTKVAGVLARRAAGIAHQRASPGAGQGAGES